ncbi:MAG: Gfo/Idh/MocA family oxidoreductase [Candidatus Omnitrophica bacterium]|jgi:predicted dehydrogenase|nr:Gfo/Idh/MocA family oxidoreductase [Candidatus Omnitrophota bacterium]
MLKGNISIGIIGCGHWGPNYIRSFQRIKGISLKCICDSDEKQLNFIKDKYPYLGITSDSREVIKDTLLDAVIIATPAKTHYSLVKKALLWGKHVLVEKPLTICVKEAEELAKLAKEQKKVLMPGHIFEHHDGIKEIKKYISSRSLGKLYYLYSRRTNLGPIRNDVNAIWDLALHDISIFNFILAKTPQKVKADGFPYLRPDIEDVGFITLFYPDNIVAHIHVSWLDPRKIREIVLVGNKKMLMFNDLDYLHPIRIYDKRVMKRKYERPYHTFEEFKMIIKDGQVSLPKLKVKEPLLSESQYFIDCIRKRQSANNFLARGLLGVKVLEAAKKSLRSKGKLISIK